MRSVSSGLLALVLGVQGFASQAQEVTAASSSSSSLSSPEVCESKTINYITHTLPQQCLRTNWSSSNSTLQDATTSTTTSTVTSAETATTTQLAASGETAAQAGSSQAQSGREEKKEDVPVDTKGPKDGVDDPEDLATSSFMSFEEWKAMMLQKSGQDLADLKGRKSHEGRDGAEMGPNEGLDSWGDDGEIALDFDVLSGKISEMAATAGAKSASASIDVSNAETQEPAVYGDGVAHYRRPKDAGITCKERFSYSSFDGGATVLKTSPGAKNAKAILVENKDSYMLFTCSQENKFVIVELSEDILVDTVVLANFEFFSSMIRSFRISVSDKYPVKVEKWKDVGTFQARNSRDIQAFLIDNPKIWAKYIRIEFLSHYGNEYYCPVSLLRVHGTRMLDSWKEAEAGTDDDEPAETVSAAEAAPEHEVPQENIIPVDPEATSTGDEQAAQPSPNASTDDYGYSPWYAPMYDEPYFQTCGIGTPTMTNTVALSPPAHAVNDSWPPVEPIPSTRDIKEAATQANIAVSSTSVAEGTKSDSSTSVDLGTSISTPSTPGTTAASTDTTMNKTQSVQPTAKSPSIPPKPPPGSKVGGDSSSKSSSKQPTHSSQNKTATGTSSSANASPTVQESFFKSISKRLQFLESNTTLSLQYIEDQSKFLQEALQKMERRQISRVDTFLTNLNNTVLSELRSVRQQYDQIWQSTVLALETQREQSDREIIALSSRLNLLADEVVFQKRMAIFQSVLLLCCLLLVLFSRGVLGGSGAGEQWQMTAASTSHFFNSYLGSPRWPPGSPRPVSRGNTPTQQGRRASAGSIKRGGRALHPGSVQRSVSGPAVTGGPLVSSSPTRAVSSSYTEKMLPMTPTSGVFSGDEENDDDSVATPPFPLTRGPAIRVDEPADPFMTHEPDGCRSRLPTPDQERKLLIVDIPSPEEESSSSSASTLTDGRQNLPEDEQCNVDEDEEGVAEEDPQSSRPPLTRSPLSERGGNSRKPLPALPEDPI